MTEPAADMVGQAEAELPPVEVLDEDILCKGCGYNLRGLSRAANCPECNTAIELSIIGDGLHAASPVWLATVVRGLSWLVWGKLLAIGVTVVAAILFRRSASHLGNWMAFAAELAVVYGTWAFCTPEPGGQAKGMGRPVARVAILLSTAVTLLRNLVLMFPIPLAFSNPMNIGFAVAGMVGLAVAWGQLKWAGELAGRLPNYQLEKRANFLAVAVAATNLFLSLWAISILVLRPYLIGRSVLPWFIALLGSGLLVLIPGLVFFIMEMVLLFRLKAEFRRALWHAREAWAAREKIVTA